MATLTIDNKHVYLEDAPLSAQKAVARETSYLQAGFEHTAGFKAKYWDGYRKLASMLKDGRIKVPAGLAQTVADTLYDEGVDFKVVDARARQRWSINVGWNGERELRPYQRDAIRLATTRRGTLGLVGRGIIKLPPRSGKTLISAGIIRELAARTLFIVPRTFLLHQTRRALSDALQTAVGIAGDGEWDNRDVMVASIQTLLSRRGKNTKKEPAEPEYTELMGRSDLVVFDECHHLESDEWRKVMKDSDAPYKIGLSATAFVDREEEQELGVIWLRACTGEVLIDKSVSELIEAGFLVRPEVRVHAIREPDLRRRGWSKRLHRDAIYRNADRNRKIVDVVCEHARAGRRTVVTTNRVEQVGELSRLLGQTRVRFARVIGQTPQATRDKQVKKLRDGRLDALLGTVLGEGVDIPEVDAVVVAEGGADAKATYQRLRCLTPSEGKLRAFVDDFVDLTHPYFAAHSMERLNVYRSEPAFRVSVSG